MQTKLQVKFKFDQLFTTRLKSNARHYFICHFLGVMSTNNANQYDMCNEMSFVGECNVMQN